MSESPSPHARGEGARRRAARRSGREAAVARQRRQRRFGPRAEMLDDLCGGKRAERRRESAVLEKRQGHVGLAEQARGRVHEHAQDEPGVLAGQLRTDGGDAVAGLVRGQADRPAQAAAMRRRRPSRSVSTVVSAAMDAGQLVRLAPFQPREDVVEGAGQRRAGAGGTG